MMYSVLPKLYHEAATRLADAIDGGSYFSGSILFRFDDMDCQLTASVIVYRQKIFLPQGDTEAISDLVPVWWEFHTTGIDGEVLNDFDFAELKHFI